MTKCISCPGEATTLIGNNLPWCGVPDCAKVYHAAWMRNYRKENPRHAQKVKAAWDMKKYGITLEEFDALVEKQGGRCALCGDIPTGGRGVHRKLVVDHCHKTSKVRALLCPLCNGGLGLFKDDITRLEAAITYLRSHADER